MLIFVFNISPKLNNKDLDTSLHITQHKRFVPYGAHPNFCFAKTSFMLETLGEIPERSIGNMRKDVARVGYRIPQSLPHQPSVRVFPGYSNSGS